MNFFTIFWSVITLICIYFIAKEPRRFINGEIVLFLLGTWFIILSQYGYKNSLIGLFIVTLVLMIPFIYLGIMIYLMVNGIKVIKKEGFSIANSLSLGLSLIMMFFPVVFMVAVMSIEFLARADIMFCIFTLIIYFMVTFGSFFVYSIGYCIFPRNIKCDYIIIHGAGLRKDGTVTPLLKRRIDKAIKIYEKCNGRAKLVPSGGQGADEVTSEAAAMANYLIEQGIKEEDIIKEDRSTTTFENLKYVKELLDEREEGKKYKCIFVTNNYHVLRTSFYARKIKLRAQGVGCKTAGYYLPSAFLREYVAVMKMNVVSNVLLAIFLAMIIIFI